ncbi:hypothetical protein JCM14036_01410 [Desulfotomaculum defluvii]
MNKRRLAAIILVFIMSILVTAGHVASKNVKTVQNPNLLYDSDISGVTTWENSENSKVFKITPKIILKQNHQESDTFLLYDILIENKTDKPIKNLRATAFLPFEMEPFISTPLRIFGNAKDDPIDLIPGKVPYGLYISKTTLVTRYSKLSKEESIKFEKALHLPLKMKISHIEGVEYLIINPGDIHFE